THDAGLVRHWAGGQRGQVAPPQTDLKKLKGLARTGLAEVYYSNEAAREEDAPLLLYPAESVAGLLVRP
ncbi:MAG TPA: hypothetical protein VJT09_13830, partial [Pyrinomonadaceae bacterium]|nr:hypothetical protein [Pyrinomonadaceae bacterium]